VKNAYTAAQAYFSDHPAGTPVEADLTAYGFNKSANVTIGTGMTQSAGTITAKHAEGPKTYTVDAKGVITSAP